MNILLKKMLENSGIYMNEAGADGADGGSGAPGTDVGEGEGGQETDAGANKDGEGEGDADKATGDADKDGDADKAKAPKVDDEKAKLIKDTMKWKDTARTFEQKLKDYTDALGDVDPAAARELVNKAKEQERTELEKKGEYTRIVQQMKEENQRLLEGKDTELGSVKKQLDEAMSQIENLTVGAKFRDSEYIQKSSGLTPSIAQKEFGEYFEFEDGQMVPYDKPRGAKDRTQLVDAEGKPKSFEKAIAELHEKHPEAKDIIRSTLKPGAGSRNQPDVTDKGDKSSEVRGLGKIELGLKNLGKSNQ